MMAAEGGAIITFIFNGEDPNEIPRDITHLIVHENITVIPTQLFKYHPNLVEVYCHSGVTKIEQEAFFGCLSLRRVIIPGVTIIEGSAFHNCRDLMHFECYKLERIGAYAFCDCKVLSSINLPSAKIVEGCAFWDCNAMTQAIFGKDLESIGRGSFSDCSSLESITIPLKSGLITRDNLFRGCANLKRVDLIECEALRDFADALLWESWRNDMNEVLDSINQILPDAAAGDGYYDDDDDQQGEKAIAIREWIESVLHKKNHHKAMHCELLNEAAAVLQLSLSSNAVMNTVVPFIELPSRVFDGE